MAYTTRVLDHELNELLGALPALAIEGPKGVGKGRPHPIAPAAIPAPDGSRRSGCDR